MKQLLAATLLCTSTLAALTPAQARNVKYVLPIAAALQAPANAGKVDSAIKLYFGPQAYPSSAQKLGKTNVTGKEPIRDNADLPSCQAAFANAVQQLQKTARDAGANAVVNISSYFKNDPPLASATDFECRAGSFSTILMLKGDFVRIGD